MKIPETNVGEVFFNKGGLTVASSFGRGSHLLEILNYLQLSDKCTPKDVAQIVQLHHFNENYETISYLAMLMSNMLIG